MGEVSADAPIWPSSGPLRFATGTAMGVSKSARRKNSSYAARSSSNPRIEIPLLSQLMCVETGALLRVGPFMIAADRRRTCPSWNT